MTRRLVVLAAVATALAVPAISFADSGSGSPPTATHDGSKISAGKSGNVARSLPNSAVSLENRSPVSCIPSPESPAKRTMT